MVQCKSSKSIFMFWDVKITSYYSAVYAVPVVFYCREMVAVTKTYIVGKDNRIQELLVQPGSTKQTLPGGGNAPPQSAESDDEEFGECCCIFCYWLCVLLHLS